MHQLINGNEGIIVKMEILNLPPFCHHLKVTSPQRFAFSEILLFFLSRSDKLKFNHLMSNQTKKELYYAFLRYLHTPKVLVWIDYIAIETMAYRELKNTAATVCNGNKAKNSTQVHNSITTDLPASLSDTKSCHTNWNCNEFWISNKVSPVRCYLFSMQIISL